LEAVQRAVRRLELSRSVRETLRAFAIFGVLSFALLSIAGYLMLRELDIEVLHRQVGAAWTEAQRIAEVVSSVARDREGLDMYRVRQNRDLLRSIVNERIAGRSFVRYVEIRDRFGAPLLLVARDAPRLGAQVPGTREGAPAPEPLQVIRVPLAPVGAAPAGEVRVGYDHDSVGRELEALRQSLKLRIYGAATAGILVLVVGLVYVLYLIRKNRRLEQSRLAAERRSYVGLLASGLAHEIRNPLNAMNMNLQMLEEELHMIPGAQDAETRELLDQTKREIKRLEQLVSNFLTYARPAVPHFETCNLNEVLEQVSRFLDADFRASGVELRLELEPMLPSVELDETQFKQAVMNLLVNARQVLRSGGCVRLRTRAGSGGEAVIEVEDDGPGIPADTLDRIFDVFYSNRGGGTGLGLPIARQIVDRHGGAIEVDTAEGEGTTFRIRLPRRHVVARPAEPAQATS
jgi:signal transduction histidine kinase